jgi:SAM-dependent methyltransferase
MTGYTDDLAYIHDAGFGDFARGAAPALLEALRARGITGGLVVDLGCGSGIWARALIAAGYDVLGIDISPAMIRLARRKAPGAKFRSASLLSAELPACAAVTAIGECVNYAFDPCNSRRTVAAFFRGVFDALLPGGSFIFDFAEPGQIPEATRRRKFTLGSDWAVLLDAREDKRRQILVRNIVSFRKTGRYYRRTDEVHTLRLYRRAELETELRKIGFRTKIFRRYGTMALRAGNAGIQATKPADAG